MSWFLSKGAQHQKQKRLLNPAFSIANLRGMGMCNQVDLQISLLIDILVPMLYQISNKVVLFIYTFIMF